MPEIDASDDRFSRVFEVLELLAGHSDGMRLTEIVSHLGLPASSAHNLLQRMVTADVVFVTEELRYCIGARAVRLGIRIVGELDIRTAARRSLQELARKTGEDVYLAARVGNQVSYVDRVSGSRIVNVDIRLGQSLYLHATSVGKLFAAHTPQLQRQLLAKTPQKITAKTLVRSTELEAEFKRIRKEGVAVSREEAIPGIIGIAVPVYDAESVLAAAVHISTLSAHLDKAREQQLITAAKTAAVGIEKELGRLHTNAGRRLAGRDAGDA